MREARPRGARRIRKLSPNSVPVSFRAVSFPDQDRKANMMSRRSWIGAATAGFLASSCATRAGGGSLSLAMTLRALPSIRTASELTEKFGPAAYQVRFSHDDPDNWYVPNRFSRSGWSRLVVTTPSDLIDRLPVGTNMLLYDFGYGSSLNGTRGTLFVCIDENDRIIGWMYGVMLVGHESDATMRIRH